MRGDAREASREKYRAIKCNNLGRLCPRDQQNYIALALTVPLSDDGTQFSNKN
jgi:hypothetical protein